MPQVVVPTRVPEIKPVGGGWQAVIVGSAHISVDSEGQMHLPGRHVKPDDVDDLVAAIRAAKVVAAKVMAVANVLPAPAQVPQVPELSAAQPRKAVPASPAAIERARAIAAARRGR